MKIEAFVQARSDNSPGPGKPSNRTVNVALLPPDQRSAETKALFQNDNAALTFNLQNLSDENFAQLAPGTKLLLTIDAVPATPAAG